MRGKEKEKWQRGHTVGGKGGGAPLTYKALSQYYNENQMRVPHRTTINYVSHPSSARVSSSSSSNSSSSSSSSSSNSSNSSKNEENIYKIVFFSF